MTDQPNNPNEPQPQDSPTGATPPPAAEGTATKDEKTMAMIAHLLGIVLSVIGPLVIWVMKKEESKFIDDQGKEAMNFQITILIAYVICSVLMFAIIGCILLPVVVIANLVLCIMAAMKANEGVAYRYPFALRLIK